MITTKRVYDNIGPDDGPRFLVERLWPHGITKDDLGLVEWLKEAAPSVGLGQWFAHNPAKWDEFKMRYFSELEQKPETWQAVREAAQKGNVTLIYSTRDGDYSIAAALKEYIETHA